MPPAAGLSGDAPEARAFAESIAGALDRLAPANASWSPGDPAQAPDPKLSAVLDELGWPTLAHDPALAGFAGLGAVQLGRRLVPLQPLDDLLGGSPLSGDLVRSLSGSQPAAIRRDRGVTVRATVTRSERVPSAEGLDVHRVLELGEPEEVDEHAFKTATGAWIAAGVGYLAGIGLAALDLTIRYVRERRAFGSTLGALAPVQQLLADAATAIRGIELLAGERPDGDALAYGGAAIADACAACQQVTGAIGFTLEYPLHRYTQRARALAAWNDALCDLLPEAAR